MDPNLTESHSRYIHIYSPRLPWEVIERAIGFSAGRPNTLCSLALTCRQLRPRSHAVMFSRVQLKSGAHVFTFVAFLQANPELKPLVHTLIVTPAAFGPSLLYVLPNISSIECLDESQLEEPEDENEDKKDKVSNILHLLSSAKVRVHPTLVVHHTSLACFRRLGAHIHTLRLNSISFLTSLAFVKMLFAFSSITRLVCESVDIKTAGHKAPLEVTTRRLYERMELKELVVIIYLLSSMWLLNSC